MIGESRSRVASNGNESGGAVRHGPRATATMVTRDAGGEARVAGVRAEQTDEARAKRTSGDWFLAKARSSRAGAGEDEARATRSAEERRASLVFVAVSQKSARHKRLPKKMIPSGTAVAATAGPEFSWCIVPYGSGATTPGGDDNFY